MLKTKYKRNFILTNGYNPKMKYFLKLVESHIDLHTVSIDGMGENYNKTDTLKV